MTEARHSRLVAVLLFLVAITGCGRGALPVFPPRSAPAPAHLSPASIERHFRDQGVAVVSVSPVGTVAIPSSVPRVEERLVVMLSPAPAALVGADPSAVRRYLEAHHEVLVLPTFDRASGDRPGHTELSTTEMPSELGCDEIKVTVDIADASPVTAIVQRTCTRRNRLAPDYGARPLPRKPPFARGVVLSCAVSGGGAVPYHRRLVMDDFGDVYTSSAPHGIGDYARTISPRDAEEAMGLLVQAQDEPSRGPAPRGAPHDLVLSCYGQLGATGIDLGRPDEPSRRGPATRALLRWLVDHAMIPR